MSNTSTQNKVVMGIYPRTGCFGYAVFHGPSIIHRWGVKHTRGNNNGDNIFKLDELVSQFMPDIVVLEDFAGEGSRRAERIENLIEGIAKLVEGKGITVCRHSRSMIRQCFSELGVWTKFEIAQAIAKALPELLPQLPAKKKIWLPEDPRMAIFDATALVFTHQFFETQKREAA
jgi:hypothetical protein